MGADGEAVCWGPSGASVHKTLDGPFTDVDVGANHACGLRATGVIECWGYGQTNTGSWPEMGQSIVPDERFVALDVGYGYTCGVTTAGDISCWGMNDVGQAEDRAGPFIAVSANVFHTCGLRGAHRCGRRWPRRR